ncbi:MAG TPA: serine hydrolase domain-containing protein [Chryseolinea sp.]|nr:serine hydrolase domain-containing protein [Chryseolinea sp.]HPH45697.1 serine hydrolase domain-containing protein [Chryseolinea sp.]HPM29298.1 serine hydrolase domain-containing protein [Chryseolinea sp.]
MRTFIHFLGSLILFSCSSVKESKPTISEEFDLFFQHQFPSDEPGGAVLIMKNDSVIFSKGYGLADMKSKEAISTKTLFNLGSISKTFVANAILILQEQGKLSVEDSLYKYFPNFKNKQIAQKVKIKHLLTHTSGLPDNRQVSKDTVFYLTAKDAENWYPITQTDTLAFEPGSHYEYSNPAFNGLALIVEKVSGMKWQQFIAENIFKPSGMTTSTITDGPHPEKGVSHGYVLNHSKWTEDDYDEEPTFPAAGNGGVWSSVEELAKYEQALKMSKFIKEETLADSRTIQNFSNWKDFSLPFIGWSWFITKQDSLTLVGHSGSQGGFLSNYVTVPDKGIFFVILCNAPREKYEMQQTTFYVLDILSKHNVLGNE